MPRENSPSTKEALPERLPPTNSLKHDNMGEIVFPEQHPADPTKDEATCRMTHRGGAASARVELY